MSDQPRTRRGRLAAFLVPPVAVATLLYRALSDLQIALTHAETLIVSAVVIGVAGVAGLAAAFGGRLTRVLVLSATTVLLLDVTLHGPWLLDGLTPDVRAVLARDLSRVRDLRDIHAALERHLAAGGDLMRPANYGEGVGPETFWRDWWDTSAADSNGDGRPFMEFLVDAGAIPEVPVDPVNDASDAGDPRLGHQYVYFVAPGGYDYEGGVCPAAGGSVYLLAITAFETPEASRSGALRSPGCECLWRDRPDFFAQHFDYVVCGSLER